MFRRKYKVTENYQDKVARLYGQNREPSADDSYHEGLTRTCTLQVTDACNLRCTYCVSGNTHITMVDKSSKPIRDVQVGDEIIAFNEATGELETAKVEQLFQRQAVTMTIVMDDQTVLQITPNHSVFMRGKDDDYGHWVEADELRKYMTDDDNPGCLLYMYDSHTNAFSWKGVSTIKYNPRMTDVYNIGTSTHTYLANDIGVHNCYQINKQTHRMSFDIAKRYIDMLLEDDRENDYVNTKISEGLIVEFIGGEPLLEIDLIDKVTDYLYDRMIELDHPWRDKFMISICSNGVLYFDPKFQEYITKNKYHLSFSISIDGNKELHDACRIFPDGSGSYDIAIAGVKHFKEFHHGHMGSKMTIAPGNVDKVFVATQNLIALGYEEIFLNCVYEEGWDAHYANILYNQLKQLADYIIEKDLFDKIYFSIFEDANFCPMSPEDNNNWCGGTGSMLSCDYKGDLYPCIRYMESSLGNDREPVIIGNVYDGLLPTDKEKDIIKCMRCVTRRSQSTDECFNCPIASGCSWCSAYNYQVFGTVDKRATYICIMHKARALANAYFWNKGFRTYAPFLRFKIWVPDEWALEIIDHDELDMLKDLESFGPEHLKDVEAYEVDVDTPEYNAYKKACLDVGRPIICNPDGKTTRAWEYVSTDGTIHTH